MTIAPDTTLSRNGDILYAPAGTGETVMLNADRGIYYGLNAVASRIWELLENPKSLGQLCQEISAEFETDSQTCQTDVMKFVEDMIANGIAYVSPEAADAREATIG